MVAAAIVRRAIDGLAVAVVLVALTGLVLGRILPAIGHPVYIVAGPSMEARIPIGAAVVLDRVAPTELRVGDVVSIQSGAQQAVFTHRIVRIAGRADGLWIETKGDANVDPDPSITSTADVIGRVGLSLPFAGYLIMLLSNTVGIELVLLAISVI